ncbi:MAG: hypothetical protein HYT12_00205 [Candidatus Liptonbacteria bacterium]|nr:hypothetical protein [Candidatus Liptonbacteria bacterium]
MLKNIKVYIYPVEYDEKDYDGIKYLRDDLQTEESKVFFEQAKLKGEARFEDDREGQWSLQYNKSNASYLLVRR